MYIAGFEGTAHTASVGIVTSEGDILANISSSIKNVNGIHPRVAANHHADAFPTLLKDALVKSGLNRNQIGLVAYSRGPGLGPCLRTTATAARAFALYTGVPIVGVNHSVAHIEIGRLSCMVDDPLILYLSGGNTQIVTYSKNLYRVIGETLDIGIGNFLDKLGRDLSLSFPSGPKIEQIAKNGKMLVDVPYTVKGMDVAFSGLLTALEALYSDGSSKEDVCYTAQEVSFAIVTEVVERAVVFTRNRDLLLVGGVARNRRLQEMVSEMLNIHNSRLHVPPPELCTDNGAMIAWNGFLAYKSNGENVGDLSVEQRYRTDTVRISWRN